MPDADVHDLGPNHKLDPPVVVEVLHEGHWSPGEAYAWRAERVQVRYTVAPGMTYSNWQPADRVKRVGGSG